MTPRQYKITVLRNELASTKRELRARDRDFKKQAERFQLQAELTTSLLKRLHHIAQVQTEIDGLKLENHQLKYDLQELSRSLKRYRDAERKELGIAPRPDPRPRRVSKLRDQLPNSQFQGN